jgi:hypothetical protein
LAECDTVCKLVCVFCSKLFDKKEQKPAYESHIQNHLSKSSLTKSPTTTVSSTDYFFLNNYEENRVSSSTSSSTSSNSNSTILTPNFSSTASSKPSSTAGKFMSQNSNKSEENDRESVGSNPAKNIVEFETPPSRSRTRLQGISQ